MSACDKLCSKQTVTSGIERGRSLKRERDGMGGTKQEKIIERGGERKNGAQCRQTEGIKEREAIKTEQRGREQVIVGGNWEQKKSKGEKTNKTKKSIRLGIILVKKQVNKESKREKVFFHSCPVCFSDHQY